VPPSGRLREAGARVLVSLNGRSAASVDRIRCAGLEAVHDDQRLTDGIDCILSIVPPAAALEIAERLSTPLRNAASPPPFADCNAISPTTMHRIERLLDPLPVIDAGIIGGPPLPGSQDPSAGPRFYASGPPAHRLAALTRYGPRYRRDGRAYRRRVGSQARVRRPDQRLHRARRRDRYRGLARWASRSFCGSNSRAPSRNFSTA